MSGRYYSRSKLSTSPYGGVFEDSSQEQVQVFSPVRFVDDFLGSDVVIPAAGSPESGCKWVSKIVGAAPPTVVGKADEVNGAIECALTATSEKQNADLYFNDELQLSVLQNLVIETRVKLSVLPTTAVDFVFGLISAWADGTDATTYNAMFKAAASGALLWETDDNATNDDDNAAGVTVLNTTWVVLRIDCTDAATSGIKFYINGALVGTSAAWAASAANSKVQPIISMYKASGTGVGTVLVDYVKISQERS